MSFLPGDRLSQVTRRGMLSDTKGEGWHVGYQTKTGLKSKGFSGGATVGRGILREQTRVAEGDLVDSSLSNRLQGHGESNLVRIQFLIIHFLRTL